MTGPDINKILNSLQIILFDRDSGKHAINQHLLILGIDWGPIHKTSINNLESVGYVPCHNKGYLIIQVFWSGHEWVDLFGDGLWGDESFVDFGLLAAEQLEVDGLVGELDETVVVVDGGFEQSARGLGLDLALWPVF